MLQSTLQPPAAAAAADKVTGDESCTYTPQTVHLAARHRLKHESFLFLHAVQLHHHSFSRLYKLACIAPRGPATEHRIVSYRASTMYIATRGRLSPEFWSRMEPRRRKKLSSGSPLLGAGPKQVSMLSAKESITLLPVLPKFRWPSTESLAAEVILHEGSAYFATPLADGSPALKTAVSQQPQGVNPT